MFADVSGSTRLYEKLGDAQANIIISEVVELMSDITRRNSGVVIKTIGDEVMCKFNTVDDAINAACMIQLELDRRPAINGVNIGVHIGLHWGNAIINRDGDMFGDAVNVAARITGIARVRQIITTESTAKQMSPELREKSREIDRTTLKGKAEDIVIYEVVWEPEDVTRISTPGIKTHPGSDSPLVVQYRELRKIVSKEIPLLTFGRSAESDICIDTDLASRPHFPPR